MSTALDMNYQQTAGGIAERRSPCPCALLLVYEGLRRLARRSWAGTIGYTLQVAAREQYFFPQVRRSAEVI